MDTHAYARWFRDSTPYISAHRRKTFVVLIGADALTAADLTSIVHDLALLHTLGVRLVLVHGCREQLDEELPDATFVGDRRVTDESTMRRITHINGRIRSQLEALFSMGLPSTPMHNTDITVVGGNFVTARPVGVIDGVDHLFTGRVRKVRTAPIHAALEHGALVLLSPMGYSPSGQVFNLTASELAADVAIALKADKLIAFDVLPHLKDADGRRVSGINPGELDTRLDDPSIGDNTANHLRALGRAVRSGVARGHLVSYLDDGALLAELFTAAGVGTQVSEKLHGMVRRANVTDVAAIVDIIRPMEESGALVRRSRDRLEAEIDHFLVAEVDGIVVGTCALFPHDKAAELSCVAVRESFQNQPGLRVGTHLVEAAERLAAESGITRLFVLTTQAHHWFERAGFTLATVDDLPMEKKQLYNLQRQSKVLFKTVESV
ncbi:MAG: amino-acid N-acetyltransferase [Pseudomonadales bacterium]